MITAKEARLKTDEQSKTLKEKKLEEMLKEVESAIEANIAFARYSLDYYFKRDRDGWDYGYELAKVLEDYGYFVITYIEQDGEYKDNPYLYINWGEASIK